MRNVPVRPLVALIGALILGSTPDRAFATWSHDPGVNNPVVVEPSGQDNVVGTTDGQGGMVVAFRDFRSGTEDIYAQRILADGSIAPGWPATGVPVCTAAGAQDLPVIDYDGAGGVIIAWIDVRLGGAADVYAQRILLDGSIAPGWPVDGVAVLNSPQSELFPVVVGDGAGGGYVVWRHDFSVTDLDIYAKHLSPAGTLSALFIVAASGLNEDQAIAVSDGAGGALIAWRYDNLVDTDIYTTRLGPGGVLWTIPSCQAAGDQYDPAIDTDDLGGALVAWTDERSGIDIYAQHIRGADGYVFWPTDGVPVVTAPLNQSSPRVAQAPGGGMYVVWQDYRNGAADIYAQRLSSGGATAPGWITDGRPVCTATDTQQGPDVIPDGQGGVYIAWEDRRGGVFLNTDLYASRLDGAGSLVTGWQSDGTPVSIAYYNQYPNVMLRDDTNGLILGWYDYRSDPGDVFAQRMGLYGQLGNAEPAIVSVRDVVPDQGGQVRISWTPSYLDVGAPSPIGQYSIWRQVPQAAAQRAGATWRREGGEAVIRDAGAASPPSLDDKPAPAPLAPGTLWARHSASGVIYWEYVGTMSAQGFSGYSYVAGTAGDSIGGANPYTTFMVEAVHASSWAHWESAPDSGYSVDNVAPPATQPFTGAFTPTSTLLQWGANPAPDLAFYRLYRGTTPDFPLESGTLVATTTAKEWADDIGAPFHYKLVAVDTHGNVGAAAATTPSGIVDVEAELPRVLELAAVAPNPMSGHGTLRFGLPRSASVRLTVFDTQGRRVRLLVDAPLAAGMHSVAWDGRDASGAAVSSGLYVVRLEAEGRTLVRRMTMLR